ncbi:MAG: hypothetical protein IJJ23_09685 [Clostridia bacterium]|nr:hypothetical protein [Clostridia bacterium]
MIRENYETLRAGLEKEFAACSDVKDAADCVGRVLEKLRMQARAEAETPALSRETDRLFDAAKQASLLLLSATEADIAVQPIHVRLTRRERIKKALPWISAGVSLLLTAWREMLGQHLGAVIALLGAGAAVTLAYLRTDPTDPAAMTARTRVNAHELLRMLDRLVQALDENLSQAGTEHSAAAPGDQPALTSDWYAPLQMLMEAVYTGDGDYALKAVPQIEQALQDQGIELVAFSEEKRAMFDMFPGTEPGLTIRPAVMRGERLLARGQATERMK